jgi:hypothetical protein
MCECSPKKTIVVKSKINGMVEERCKTCGTLVKEIPAEFEAAKQYCKDNGIKLGSVPSHVETNEYYSKHDWNGRTDFTRNNY